MATKNLFKNKRVKTNPTFLNSFEAVSDAAKENYTEIKNLVIKREGTEGFEVLYDSKNVITGVKINNTKITYEGIDFSAVPDEVFVSDDTIKEFLIQTIKDVLVLGINSTALNFISSITIDHVRLMIHKN